MTINLLIADDHGVLRAGLIALLNAESDLKVVGESDCAEEVVQLAGKLRPDIILMDISMPEMGGINATRIIHEQYPEVKILILSIHEDNELFQEAIRSGATGYLLKRAVKSELMNAIHSVSQGCMYVHPALTRSLLKHLIPSSTRSLPTPVILTQREREILRLLVQGHTNFQIAEVLKISERTVEFHRANLTKKLNMHRRVDLYRYALENKLLTREQT
jgi:two-component system, NarL family, response regulator NreC